jgi:hypothetical protein
LYGDIVAEHGMTFLLVCKQKKNIDTFEGVVAALLSLGHRVILTVQEPDAARDARLARELGATSVSPASPLPSAPTCWTRW